MANAVFINDNRFQLIGFDNFMFRELAARKGRNPQSTEELDIQCRKVPAFKQQLENNLLLLHNKKSDGMIHHFFIWLYSNLTKRSLNSANNIFGVFI